MATFHWQSEFSDDYRIPELVQRLVEEGYADDLSWHNDVCPRFGFIERDGEDEWQIVLAVDHPDEGEREGGLESPRYWVVVEMGDETIERTYHTARAAVKGYLQLGKKYDMIGKTSKFNLDKRQPRTGDTSAWMAYFPEHAVPTVVERLVDEGYAEDLSDRHDASPTFGFDVDDDEEAWSLLLWVEHPDEGKREDGVKAPRYNITYMVDGEMVEETTVHRAVDAVKAYLAMGERHELIDDTDNFDPDSH